MTKSHGIEVVFFDIGGVLVELNLGPFMTRIMTVIKNSAIEFDEARGYAAYKQLEIGEYTFSQYHQAAYADGNSGYIISESEIRKMWLEMLNKETGAVELMRQVRERKPVWLLTNNNEVHIPYLEGRFTFMQEVDGMISSHLVGCRKPDAAIYELAIQRANTTPGAAIFIDDLEENVATAQALGFHVHHYTDAAGLADFLRQWDLIDPAG
ncbi:HAD family hydrolase [Candidatus Neomarinimicrobiota bacterium]